MTKGWQPIETADPKNEEETFLVWCPGLRVSGPCVVAYRTNGTWVAALTGYELPAPPTHWMPLPEPPASGIETGTANLDTQPELVERLTDLHDRIAQCWSRPTGSPVPRRARFFTPKRDDVLTLLNAIIELERALPTSKPEPTKRQKALAEMTRLDEGMGLYDDGASVPLSPNVVLEVRPCLGVDGNVRCYDLGPPTEPGATGGCVVASVYSGKETADEIARLWNAYHPISCEDEVERLREALNAIIDRVPERDAKWSGMNARDIAIAAMRLQDR